MKLKTKSWVDINLRQLQEIESLPTYDDDLDLMINQISILNDVDSNTIENMPLADLVEEFNQWGFLKELPKEKNNKVIKVGKTRLGFIELNKMSLAQLVDIEEYVSDGLMKNMHKILSVLYIPIKTYNYLTKSYTLKEYSPDKERQELFLDLTMDLLYPQILFFCRIVKVYLDGFPDSSEHKTMMEVMMMNKTMKRG
jgi:hypothetical protein